MVPYQFIEPLKVMLVPHGLQHCDVLRMKATLILGS